MAKRFGFTEVQANHILDLQLVRLTQLGHEELAKEAKELNATIKELRRILAKRDVLLGVIREELTAIRDAHKQSRRTEIAAGESGVIDTEALVEDEPLVVTVTARGYVKAVPERARATKVASPGERDALVQVLETSTMAGVLFFTDRGRAYRAVGRDLPKERLSAAQNLFQFGEGERLVAIVDARAHEEHEHLVFVTRGGMVKRTALSEFVEASGRRDGIVAMKLNGDDRVVTVFPGWDDYELLVVSASGQAIRFAEEEVRPVGRSAGGIRGIRLKGDDRVVGACAVAHEELVVVATEQGYAKRVRVDDFPVQARGGAGLRAQKVDRARGPVAGVASANDHVVLLTADAAVGLEAAGVRLAGREGGGARVNGVDGAVQRVLAAVGTPA
jgi:DNA gyrase subunit A